MNIKIIACLVCVLAVSVGCVTVSRMFKSGEEEPVVTVTTNVSCVDGYVNLKAIKDLPNSWMMSSI